MPPNILDVPVHLRPREKLAERGARALSNTELLMILLGSGGAKRPVRRVAQDLLKVLMKQKKNISLKHLTEVKGVGLAKASLLLAAFEVSRRQHDTAIVKIRQPRDILPLVNDLKSRQQEHFVAVSLNGNHEVLHTRVVTIGLANFCQIHPREVFADILSDRATAAIVAHNHPSGNLEPSSEDLAVTLRLNQAAQILGIKLLDHIIFGATGYLSLRDRDATLFAPVNPP